MNVKSNDMKNILSILLIMGLLIVSCSKEPVESVTQQITPTKMTQTLTGWDYEFPEGWTIFSLPIEPEAGTNPAVVFNEIADKVIIMKTWGLFTGVWWPEVNVNGLYLDCRVGYMAKFSEACTITIPGMETFADVEVLEGWQMIGFPEQDTIQSGTAYYFGDDWDEFDMAKNIDGSKLIWPSQGIDATIIPGDGFLLHNDVGDTKTEPIVPQKMYFDMTGKRISYADINGRAIEVTMWDQRIVEIYKNNGGCDAGK